jgi:hypothetical protein
VSFLCLAVEYVAFSRHDVHVIVGEFAPLLPGRFFDLLQVPYGLMAVHDLFLLF